MALHPECDSAIEDIISEALVSDTNDSPVDINLDNLNASDGIKKKVRDAFKFIKDLMDFDKKLMRSIETGMLMVDYFIIKL